MCGIFVAALLIVVGAWMIHPGLGLIVLALFIVGVFCVDW